MENFKFMIYNRTEVIRMSNNFFEAVLNPTWKTLSNEMKTLVIQNVVRHFVNPILEVTEISPVSYQFGGFKIDTFEITIDGVEYVFVPGQKKCILGWDNGLSGLSGLDCSEERQELRYALKRYCNQHLISTLLTETGFLNQDFSHIRLSTDYIEEKINASTSPLREVDIPALLVEKKPKFVGLKYIGEYNVVSGQLSHHDYQSDEMLQLIQEILYPEGQNHHFLQDYPTVGRKTSLLIQQNQLNSDVFDCYVDDAVSYSDLKRDIERNGMGLLKEDEWEYCCGGSCRRLFKWGNQLKRQLFKKNISPLWKENMFGLFIANAEFGPELIDDEYYTKGGWLEETHKAPIINLLPLSSYYRGEGIEDQEKDLIPGYYCVRRVIRIDLK